MGEMNSNISSIFIDPKKLAAMKKKKDQKRKPDGGNVSGEPIKKPVVVPPPPSKALSISPLKPTKNLTLDSCTYPWVLLLTSLRD